MNPGLPREIRVLVVEDSLSDAELIGIYLEDVPAVRFSVLKAETLGEGIAILKSEVVDVILLDLSLPDSFGIETCQKVRRTAPSLPIIVLTGLDDEAIALEAMQIGTQDYLVKGEINGPLLARSIRYSIERQKVQELQRQSDERVRLITEQLPAVLWTTDLDLRITSPSVHVLLAIDDGSGDSVVGKTLSDYFQSSDDRFPLIAAHRRAVEGASESQDVRWKGRSLSVHVEPLRDSAGNIIGTIGISLDVSSQKRMQEELTAAWHVQQALFPRHPPKIAGFDIAGAVYPAEETAGDYFDFIPMADDCIGLVVGDVTGHGLGPALLMAELRAYLRALAYTRPHAGEILMLANRFLVGDLEEHRFVTLFFARFDPKTSSITYASAGHGGYVLRANGDVENLRSTGLPLGLIADTIINTSFPVHLAPGDILFVPTDGIQEAHTATNELYGLDRVLELVARHRGDSAESIIEALRSEVCRFVGSPVLADDMSAIVVRRQ